MLLKDYLEEHGTPVTVLARRAGISVPNLFHIIEGQEPKLLTAIKIEDATKGQVTLREIAQGVTTPARKKNKTK